MKHVCNLIDSIQFKIMKWIKLYSGRWTFWKQHVLGALMPNAYNCIVANYILMENPVTKRFHREMHSSRKPCFVLIEVTNVMCNTHTHPHVKFWLKLAFTWISKYVISRISYVTNLSFAFSDLTSTSYGCSWKIYSQMFHFIKLLRDISLCQYKRF